VTLKHQNLRTCILFVLLFLVASNVYSQDIKRIKITHNGGSDYSLGHLFLFNGATQYLTDYSSTISAGSNDFTFDYTVSKKRDGHGHIENLVRQGTSQNQKYWDGTDQNSTTWWSSGTSSANTYVEADFGVGGQAVTDIILTAWVQYGYSNRIYNQTIEVYDGNDSLIKTYDLSDSIYSSSGKYIFHITTNESDVNISSVKASLPDTSWNANGGAKAVYTLADLTPAPDTAVPTASIAYTMNGNEVTSVKNGDAVRVTATFNEAIADSPVMQISGSGVTTLSTTNMTKTSATSYYYDWTVGGGDGIQTFAFATGTDVAGNVITSVPTSGATITVDSTAPTMVITSAEVSDGATSANATLALTFTSSEATTDFAVGDITVSNGVISSFASTSSTVYTATFTPSSDGATTIDVAGSTFTDAVGNNNTAATQFNWSYDSTAPTMVITSAEVSDGATSANATLALTFTSSEATTDFAVGDITVSNGVISSFASTSSTVYTATFTPSSDGATTIDVAGSTFTDAVGNNNTAATQFNWSYLSDPTTKKDVIGSIEASVDIASQWTQSTFSTISDRLDWLKSHKGQANTSFQGIRFDFNDATINALMAGPSASITETNWTNAAINQVNRANDSLSTLESNIGIDLTKAALNEAAIMRENATGTLNPAFKPILNGWSLWTAGMVSIGNADATSTSSKQASKAHSISIGLDKPMDDKGLVGYVLRTGQGSVDVGTSTSKVKSESYSLSGYRAYEGDNNLSIEAIAGVGVVKYNLTRANGVDTLTGGRIAHQAFASFTMSKPATVFGKLSLSPFMEATYNHTWFGRYSESGGVTALTYKEHAINETQLGAGIEVRYQLFVGNTNVLPYARVSYSLDVSDQANVPAQMYYSSNPSKVYSLALDKRSTGSVQFALGAELITMDGVNASLGYERNTVMNAGYSESVSLRVGQSF